MLPGRGNQEPMDGANRAVGRCAGWSQRNARLAASIALGALLVSVPTTPWAQEAAPKSTPGIARLFDRPYTQAELGLGAMWLPAKEVCLAAPATCTRENAPSLCATSVNGR